MRAKTKFPVLQVSHVDFPEVWSSFPKPTSFYPYLFYRWSYLWPWKLLLLNKSLLSPISLFSLMKFCTCFSMNQVCLNVHCSDFRLLISSMRIVFNLMTIAQLSKFHTM